MKLHALFLALFTFALSTLLPQTSAAAGKVVAIPANVDLQPGSILIRERERALYFILDRSRAIRYPVAVPKAGKKWSGYARINGKHAYPAWAPPADVKRDNPHLPDLIPGGAPNNPMGVAALTLTRDEIAIHGTTQAMRSSMGTAASYGCIRMLNEDIADLYQRVGVGTLVLLVP